MKYYFCDAYDESVRCHTLKFLQDYANENEITDLRIVEAKIETGTSYFYCTEYGEIGETGESCGKTCDKYLPRNGKSGRCKSHSNCYIETDIVIFLNPKEDKP